MQEQELISILRRIYEQPHVTDRSQHPRSAVLVPLIQKPEGLSVLFEVRSADLSWQPGDICFPGGRIEERDVSPMTAAIRETSEELGIERQDITLLGTLDDVASNIGVMLYPFIGYISATELNPNAQEVAEIFTVPLRHLLEIEPLTAEMEMATRPRQAEPFATLLPDYQRDWKVRTTYQVSFYQYQKYVIWGLTAKVLQDFLETYRNELSKLDI